MESKYDFTVKTKIQLFFKYKNQQRFNSILPVLKNALIYNAQKLVLLIFNIAIAGMVIYEDRKCKLCVCVLTELF